MADKFLNMLGIAKRAGILTVGFDMTVEAVTKGTADTVFCSLEASERTRRKLLLLCREKHIIFYEIDYSSGRLGYAVGRGDTAVFAVTDRRFSKKMSALLPGHCDEIHVAEK